MTNGPARAADNVPDWPWLADASGQRIALTAELRARRAGPFSLAQIRSAAITLGGINRYTGRQHVYWPDDAHSLLVGRIARALLPEAEPYGLAHELHEAWLSDMTTPYVTDLALWMGTSAVEQAIKAQKSFLDSLIFPALGLQWPMPAAIADAVKRADLYALDAERRDFFPETPRWAHESPLLRTTVNRLVPERLKPVGAYSQTDRFWRALCAACPGLPRPEAA